MVVAKTVENGPPAPEGTSDYGFFYKLLRLELEYKIFSGRNIHDRFFRHLEMLEN